MLCHFVQKRYICSVNLNVCYKSTIFILNNKILNLNFYSYDV